MTPEAALVEAKKGELRPFYFVVGSEAFLRDQVVAELRAAALGTGVAAFNEDRFTAGEVDVEKILAAARTVPMMAPRRFVLVRGAERWDSGAPGEESEGKRENPLDRLAQYAAAPIDSTCVVVVASKIDGRRRLATASKKQDFAVVCDSLDNKRLASWIVQRAKGLGHAMDRDVAELLAELAGPDLSQLADAVERLSLFVGPNAPVTEDAVSECVTRVRTADTWALVEAVGKRDLGGALRLLAEVYDPRDRGLPLLGALAWSVRQLTRFQAAVLEGKSDDEAARTAGVYQPFRARELAQKVRSFPPQELERWIQLLAEADICLKASRRPADAILEDMLLGMAGKTRPRALRPAGPL